MKVQELIDKNIFQVVTIGDNLDQDITKPFCCDLLSFAMSKATAGAAWITVMGNINTLAVATLTDISCIILAHGVMLDSVALEKAKVENITVLCTELSIFDAAYKVHKLINDETIL
ncbi:MAG: hypothetical protein K0S41_514 [Anaerocolumna sp.]|jgi:hypothetical protein|nr:hypothetical protein [Anaerocolumna sp.]